MTSLFTIPFDFFPQNSDGEIRLESDWIARRLGECHLQCPDAMGPGIKRRASFSVSNGFSSWSEGAHRLTFFIVAGEFASIGGIGIIIVIFYSVKWSLGRQVIEFFQPPELDDSRFTGSHPRHRIISPVEGYNLLTRRKRRFDMLVNKENSPGVEV